MDWKEIKESCPKAYKRGQDWWTDNIEHYQRNGIVDEYESLTVSERFLYDFFDGEGIYITVRPYNFRVDKWFYAFWGIEVDYEMLKAKTRTEAEEQAFLRAFEILELKLK